MKRMLFLGVMLFAACSGNSFAPDNAVVYSGTVVALNPVTFGTAAPSIHVKSSTDQQCGVIFSMTNTTPIRVRVQNQTADGDVDVLKVGSKVNVYFSGIVAESCPAQGGAYAVEVVQP